MNTLQHVTVRAPLARLRDAVARVEDWPRLLAHYRWVKVHASGPRGRDVEMAASRDGFPCRWRSLQVVGPRSVYFRHTHSFWTQGMEVWWRFRALPGGLTQASLSHDLPPSQNFLVERFRQDVVGRLFVEAIAAKTMGGLKARLEGR